MRKKELTDREQARLKGRVAKVMALTYHPKLEKDLVTEGPLADGLSIYDDLNHILTFNADGNLAHELQYGKRGEWEEKIYVGKNMVGETRKFVNGKLQEYSTNTFNESGQVLHCAMKMADGSMKFEAKFSYNDAGQILTNVHDNHQHPDYSQITSYLYDDQGRHIGNEVRRKQTGEVVSRFRRFYDEHGREKESVHEHTGYESVDLNNRSVPIYNEHGDQVGVDRYDLKGNHIKHQRWDEEFKYDAEGKRIKEARVEEEQFTFQDKEDRYGNWIWRLVLEEGEPQFVMVRQIQYEGEPEPNWVHPLSEMPDNDDSHKRLKAANRHRQPMSDEDVRFIYSQENLTPDQFPLHRYYVSSFKFPPSLTIYNGNIEAKEVLEYSIEHFGAKKVFEYCASHSGWQRTVRYTLEFGMYPGYLIHAPQIHEMDEDTFIVPGYFKHFHGESVEIGAFHFLRPPETSALKNDFFEMMVEEMFSKMTMKKRPDKPKISLIEVRNGNFTLVERPVQDNFSIRDLDINYGHGFEQFHNELMGRFNSSNKGLVLFHGVPGTGKTYYIRHLLRQIALARKSVIYMPPNMVDHLTDPGFMTFLTSSVQNLSTEGQFCVLLIEDAEPLLAKRVEGVRIQGVTNLLNMTDGLLNDMLNLQIICTFNVDLRKLDSALLRPGRLLARKEFKPLSTLDANLLAQRLGIKKHFSKPTSLGEIYAMLSNQNTLVHDVEPTKDSSRPIDDLL